VLTTEEFLDVVWGTRRGYVDVPSKTRGHWMPFIAEWPQDRAIIRRRIRDCVDSGWDVYFSVAQFRKGYRREEETLPTDWLWADLDVEDPVFMDEEGLLPTLAWESSPGRYQAMWKLDRELEPAIQTKLNRRLTYALAADRGGYDLTQVLRPAGTKNFKYGTRIPFGGERKKDPTTAPDVEVLWHLPDLIYTPRGVLDAVKVLEAEQGTDQRGIRRKVLEMDRHVMVGRLTARTRRLLTTPENMVVAGERSHRLWELECLLAEQGLEEDQIVELVRSTAWNKWKGMGSEERQLLQDARKAVRHVAKRAAADVRKDTPEDGAGQAVVGEDQEGTAEERDFFIPYSQFIEDRLPTPRWLIEDIWAVDSHGFIGGEPKVSKSTFSMAMALAVASGKPFLGRYRVPEPGPVLLIQEENAPWMVQDRFKKLAHSMGLMSRYLGKKNGKYVIDFARDDYPLFLLNNYGFDLTTEEDCQLMRDEIKKRGAKLVILDPFYLMMGDANINNQHEVGPLLKWLTAVRYETNCAIAIVHHWAKYNENTTHRRPGQRLIGTAIQHGWVESGLYLAAEGYNEEKDELEVKVEREFRNSKPLVPLTIKWKMGAPGELDMEVETFDYNMNGRIAETLHDLGFGRDNDFVSLKAFAMAMDLDPIAARKMVDGSEDFRVRAKKWGRGQTYHIVSRNGA